MTASYSGTITNNSNQPAKLMLQGVAGGQVVATVPAGQSAPVSGVIALTETIKFDGKPGASADLSGTVDNTSGAFAVTLMHDPAGPAYALASADAGDTALFSVVLVDSNKVWLRKS